MKRRIRSSSTASAQGTSPVLLVEGLPTGGSQMMTRCCSLRLLYKVHAIKLDLQSQLHQVVLFSHYSSTELSKEQLFLGEILQPAFQGLALSRCHPSIMHLQFVLIKLIFCVRSLGYRLIAKIGLQPNKYGRTNLLEHESRVDAVVRALAFH